LSRSGIKGPRLGIQTQAPHLPASSNLRYREDLENSPLLVIQDLDRLDIDAW